LRESPSEAWQRCRGYIEDALEYAGGTHLIEDVEDAIERGEAWFWPGQNSALVTEFLEFPRLKACSYWLAGGDLAELLAMTPEIEHWAKQHGCGRIIECGRPGWVRALKAHGYSPIYTVLGKALT
jgi:hypothetical protein